MLHEQVLLHVAVAPRFETLTRRTRHLGHLRPYVEMQPFLVVQKLGKAEGNKLAEVARIRLIGVREQVLFQFILVVPNVFAQGALEVLGRSVLIQMLHEQLTRVGLEGTQVALEVRDF